MLKWKHRNLPYDGSMARKPQVDALAAALPAAGSLLSPGRGRRLEPACLNTGFMLGATYVAPARLR